MFNLQLRVVDVLLILGNGLLQNADLGGDQLGLLLILFLELLGICLVFLVLFDLRLNGLQLFLGLVLLGLQFRLFVVRQRDGVGGDGQRYNHCHRQRQGNRFFYDRR